MKLKEYIKYRQVLDDLEINIIDKEKYRKIGNDYDILVQLAEDNSKKETDNSHFSPIVFSIIIGVIISLFFKMGYAEGVRINLFDYIFFVIVLPFILIVISFISFIYNKVTNKENIFIGYLIDKFFEIIIDLKNKFYSWLKSQIPQPKDNNILENLIKISPIFFIQIIAITYAIFSTLLLGIYTGGTAYSFQWSSTWLEISDFSFFYIDISMPNELKSGIDGTSFIARENISLWLKYIILLTIVWIIIPRIILSILYYFKLKQDLRKSFIENGKHIIDTIKPKTTTTGEKIILETEDIQTKTELSSTSSIKITDSLKQTVIFWQLSKRQLYKLNMANEFNDTNKILLNSVSELDKYTLTNNKNIKVLINSNEAPKMTFKNLLNRIDNSYKFEAIYVNKNGDILTSKDSDVASQWEEFIKERNEK